MSESAIAPLWTLRDSTLALAAAMRDEEWLLASDCAGWSVRDVYAHMAGSLHGLVDPAFMRMGDDLNDMEAAQEIGVAERRVLPVADIVAEYEEFSAKAIENFVGMQGNEIGEMEIPMGNLGTHPLHILANAFVFDAYCHLRNDLIAPFGPLDREPPAASAEVLGPIVEWMIAGLPQMCANELAFMDRPVELVLDGPGGGRFHIGPEGEPVATITSTPDAFVRWGTQRRTWQSEDVSISGDEAYGSRVAEACNVI